MAAIPENEVTLEDMILWNKLQEELSKLKAQEVLMRTRIFKGKFKTPKEGVNKFELANGWVLNGTHKINRTVDAGALDANKERYAEIGIVLGNVIKYTPELKTAEYRKLTPEQMLAFDESLIIKDGTPALEIVLPKRAQKPAA